MSRVSLQRGYEYTVDRRRQINRTLRDFFELRIAQSQRLRLWIVKVFQRDRLPQPHNEPRVDRDFCRCADGGTTSTAAIRLGCANTGSNCRRRSRSVSMPRTARRREAEKSLV